MLSLIILVIIILQANLTPTKVHKLLLQNWSKNIKKKVSNTHKLADNQITVKNKLFLANVFFPRVKTH